MTRDEMIAALNAALAGSMPMTVRVGLRRMRRALERELEGAARGGKARAEKLSARRLSAIARKGARAVDRGRNGRFTRKEESKG